MSRLERGKLARIVRPYNDPENLDLYVTTVRPAQAGENIIAKDGFHQTFNQGDAATAWICEANKPTFPRIIAAACLRPLDGPGDDEADLLLAPLPFDIARAEHELALQGMPS